MLIKDLDIGTELYTQLDCTVLAVLVRREDGWAVYVGGVHGSNHAREWMDVRDRGNKQNETVANAIVSTLFHPGFDPGDLPYAT